MVIIVITIKHAVNNRLKKLIEIQMRTFYRKSGKAQARGLMGQSVTLAAMHPIQSPYWEELLSIEVKEEESKTEVSHYNYMYLVFYYCTF